MVDEDGDKMVSLQELLRLLKIGNNADEDGKELAINMIKAADKDDNGYLTSGELKELLMKMDPEDDEDMDETVAMFIKMGSANGDKKLKVEEAIKLFTSVEEEDPKERFKTMFRMCDSDGNGVVSRKELSTFMSSMGGDDDDDKSTSRMIIGMMMSMHDEDEDGVLSFEEFCKMMDGK